MSKKRFMIVTCVAIALFGIMTMTGCGGGDTEPTEPKIKTSIDPKNWARVEDYAVYETEPIEVEPEETTPVETEPTVEETEPVTEEPQSTPAVYYNVAKDMSRAFVTADFGQFFIGEDSFNILTLTIADLEGMGFVKGEVEKNSGVGYQYFFDGHKYTKDGTVIYIDADADGVIRAIKITTPGVAVLDNTVSINMDLNNFYDAIENVLNEGETIGRMIPAEGVKSYSHLASAGYRAVIACTTDGVQEIAIFAEDYVSTWGPISN